ncbi:MAG: Eco47II family restriction endonuclease [Clostridia bacterium]|nr:Eco47II family restriction endonuclease [Clostridia bacterium]
MYDLNFISQTDFEHHVSDTILTYNKTLQSINLEKFNMNIIDPIKLLFDKNVFDKSFKEIIDMEIQRQRDKSNTNAIGYFHQNIFRYISYCEVPKEGWDVIVRKPDKPVIYVEMKNKHNTMNSSSAQKTYIQMQNQILNTPDDYCYLVEVIAPCSRNVKWSCSVNKQHVENEKIRRVSIDKFYAEVTGENNAFYKMCRQLPITIKKIISENNNLKAQKDTVFDELQRINPDILSSLYLLAFKDYEGFEEISI